MAADEKPPRPPAESPGDPPGDVDGPGDLTVSRRAFLKSVGVTSLAGGLVTPAPAAAQGGRVVGPGDVAIQITINGRRHDLKVEPRVTLLDAVRNRLDITGQKRVCDRGACGACTMIVDGRTIYACSTLAIEMNGKSIRTVEGLATGAALHPVQQALCDADGLMCGFCTPGFVVATAALLEKNPNPTPQQARAALDGNICRCGTYVKVLEAALSRSSARQAEAGPEDPRKGGTRA